MEDNFPQHRRIYYLKDLIIIGIPDVQEMV